MPQEYTLGYIYNDSKAQQNDLFLRHKDQCNVDPENEREFKSIKKTLSK